MRRALFLLFTVPGLFAAACATPKDDGNDLGTGGKDSGTFNIDTSTVDLDAHPETIVDPDGACGAVREAADVAPVDLYVMFDKSSSMVGTKWNAAKAGLGTWVKSPEAAGLRVALNFFPRPPDATPSCDSAAYVTPRVAFGDLPTNADPMIAAIGAETPDGFDTPIYPALGGAIRGAIAEVKTRPGDRGAVLLVTDGEPTGPAPTCGGVNPEDPAVIAVLATNGFKDYAVSTFVIGLPGANATVANQIAAAGGTTSAILITNPATVETDFATALATVRGKALPCEFDLPAKVKGGEYTTSLVNVSYTKGSGGSVDLYETGDCSTGGWHYDDPTTPTKIVLCPSTCAEIRADFKAKIDILLGCPSKIR